MKKQPWYLDEKLILLSLLLSFNAYSDCLDNAITTTAMVACYETQLEIEEQKLDDMLNKAYKKSDWIAYEIEQSQKYWLQYRDAQCSAIYSFYERGTMRFIAHPSCMVELSKQRQKEIYTSFVKDW